jgi:hypothetical protein
MDYEIVLLVALIAAAFYINYLINKTKFLETQIVVAHILIRSMAKDLDKLGYSSITLSGKINDKTS